MRETVITCSILVALCCLGVQAFIGLKISRIHGRGKGSWHLVVFTPKQLDLSQYPQRAVALAIRFRQVGFVLLGSIVLAGLLRVTAP
jgi:hypothetical protein